MSTATLDSGHRVEPVEDAEKHQRSFAPFLGGTVRLQPGRWFYPGAFTRFADKIFNFKWREEDVVVMTWPKCGTTWTQEIVWTMRNNPNLVSDKAALSLNERMPFLERDMFLDEASLYPMTEDNPTVSTFVKLCPDADPKQGVNIQTADAMPGLRIIKTHLPLSLLHPRLLDTAKVVYVARNPRDVVCSYYHHCRLFRDIDFSGSLDEFVDFFVSGDVLQGPYWLHVREAWDRRNHQNMHFMFYEELQTNALDQVNKLNRFLGTKLTEEQLKKVSAYTTFPEMKSRDNLMGPKCEENPWMNQHVVRKDGGFFRKGMTGGWKENLTADMIQKLDRKTEEILPDVPFCYSV